MKTYQEKISELQQELQGLEADLVDCAPERRGQLTARAASVRRSLRWYSTRLPRRISALSVLAFDDIHTAERV